MTGDKVYTIDEIPVRFQRGYIVFERSGVPGVSATILGWTEAQTAAGARAKASVDHGIPEKYLMVQPKSLNSSSAWKEALEKQAEMEVEKRQVSRDEP